MTKQVSAMTARKNLGELLISGFYGGDEIIVERAGKPMAVLVPMAEYRRIERRRAEAFANLESVWASMPETAEADIPAAEQLILEETEAVRHGVAETHDAAYHS